MRISPDPLFALWRADKAAECLTLPDAVYTFLWNEIVPLQPPMQDLECSPAPLKKHWNKLPEEYKRQLNAAARSQR